MPATAPVERPSEVVVVVVEEESVPLPPPPPLVCAAPGASTVLLGSVAVLEIEPPEVVAPAPVVLLVMSNKDKSRCSYSTEMGCAHMVISVPETGIMDEFPRAETVVVPENVEMHPANNTELEP